MSIKKMGRAVHLCTSVILVLFVDANRAAEEAAPEVFLPPRNFNPHPYEIGYDPSERRNVQPVYENQVDPFAAAAATGGDTGPVLFPANPPESVTSLNPHETQPRDDHPINRHPYAVVAKKKKYSLGLGHYKEDRVNPQVYKALAAHGAKVLKVPQDNDLNEVNIDPSFSNQKKDYAFSYKVVDHLTGDDFSHTQSQNSHATNGEYRVKLPDGRLQIVSYTADKNGYKADVKYAENDDVHDRPVQIERTYEYEPRCEHSEFSNGYQGKPFVYDRNRGVQLILRKYGGYYGGQKVEKFVGSTLAPYTLDSSEGLTRNVAVSTLAPDLDNFNPIYIDVPHYKVATSLRHHYKK